MKAALRDLPAWPAALNREGALEYTSLSEAELRRHERAGRVIFLALGTKGEKICQLADLNRLLSDIWKQAGAINDDDMEFGDDD